jgi:hypothetical protein
VHDITGVYLISAYMIVVMPQSIFLWIKKFLPGYYPIKNEKGSVIVVACSIWEGRICVCINVLFLPITVPLAVLFWAVITFMYFFLAPLWDRINDRKDFKK